MIISEEDFEFQSLGRSMTIQPGFSPRGPGNQGTSYTEESDKSPGFIDQGRRCRALGYSKASHMGSHGHKPAKPSEQCSKPLLVDD